MAQRRAPWSLPLLAGAGALAAATWWLTRVPPLQAPAPRPALDYTGALARIAALQELEQGPARPAVNPRCRTTLLTHGGPTPVAVALFHGFTNCPAQYELFARQLFERGHNVLVPRLAHHGLADLHAPDFARLTADEMATLAAESADILHGLGTQTIVIGFSLGGAMATWVAQTRADIDHVAIIAPGISVHGVDPVPQRVAARLMVTLPNRFVGWEGAEEQRASGPNHAYPHYSTRAVGQLLRLGAALKSAARHQIYACGEVTVITNPLDETVDNRGIARIVREWRRQGAPVTTYEFSPAWRLPHDIMDPLQQDQQIARVYPQLLAWLPV
jgi:esterase/lipase